MNNQLFHITNRWALEKKHKKPQSLSFLWWQFWHKPIFAGKNLFLLTKTYSCLKKYFCQSGFYHGKNGFSTFWQKPANPVSKWVMRGSAENLKWLTELREWKTYKNIKCVQKIKCVKVRILFPKNKVRFACAEQLWLLMCTSTEQCTVASFHCHKHWNKVHHFMVSSVDPSSSLCECEV